MCEQCICDPEYFGEPLPGWYLMRARKDGDLLEIGDWALVQCNDPDVYWTGTPEIDPNSYSDDGDVVYPSDSFLDALYSQHVSVGYNLVNSALTVGYSHGRMSFCHWLWQHLAEHIRDNPKGE